jgi:ubiquinone/menaquinone biosynthesis C-methylase UbiE
MNETRAEARSRDYYDEFSRTYEERRHHGYHALIDDLELEVVTPYCGPRILEAGCGTGLILERLTRLPTRISDSLPERMAVGIDISSGMLAMARGRGLTVVQGSVDALPFPDGFFDVVASFKVLAHVPNITRALAELTRVTRPGGHLVLEFYNRYSLRALIKRLKPPTHTSRRYSDEDVFTRYDSLREIRAYLPANVELLTVRGVRVVTPHARFHDIPVVGPLLAGSERAASRAPFLGMLGGFLIVVLRRDR